MVLFMLCKFTRVVPGTIPYYHSRIQVFRKVFLPINDAVDSHSPRAASFFRRSTFTALAALLTGLTDFAEVRRECASGDLRTADQRPRDATALKGYVKMVLPVDGYRALSKRTGLMGSIIAVACRMPTRYLTQTFPTFCTLCGMRIRGTEYKRISLGPHSRKFSQMNGEGRSKPPIPVNHKAPPPPKKTHGLCIRPPA